MIKVSFRKRMLKVNLKTLKLGSITDKGVYTIVEEKTGTGATKWGKLKSGAGWISLDYVRKI